MSRKIRGLRLKKLIEKNKEIERQGGIGRKAVHFPAVRNDIVARTKKKTEELLIKIS